MRARRLTPLAAVALACVVCGIVFGEERLVGYAPFPNEVTERIRNDEIPTIMGNYDDGVGFERDECGCAYRSPLDRELGQLNVGDTIWVMIDSLKDLDASVAAVAKPTNGTNNHSGAMLKKGLATASGSLSNKAP